MSDESFVLYFVEFLLAFHSRLLGGWIVGESLRQIARVLVAFGIVTSCYSWLVMYRKCSFEKQSNKASLCIITGRLIIAN